MASMKLGILGGMGPLATAVFFEEVINNTCAENDQDHIDLVVLNHASLPDRTKSILTGNSDEFLSKIEGNIRIFEHIGVSNIAIPCNTSHYYYNEIQKMTEINVINMVSETIKYISEIAGDNSKVAVLATEGTLKSKVYEDEIERFNLEFCQVDNKIKQEVMDIIYLIKNDSKYTTNRLDFIIEKLINDYNCDYVILACTELSTLTLKKEIKPYIVDALQILVRKSIELSDKKYISY